ncbi:hypothetical protein QT971_16830 [Microcoleus sp. herbarium19]|uniref:hypothetical protein n=1 Tax=unclassified Microcoleus TaxID=2642155 RepID=UPI002FD2AD2D
MEGTSKNRHPKGFMRGDGVGGVAVRSLELGGVLLSSDTVKDLEMLRFLGRSLTEVLATSGDGGLAISFISIASFRDSAVVCA